MRLKLNYFVKGQIPDPKLDECGIDENEADETDYEDWNLLKTEITFQECVNCNTEIMTSELFTFDESIEDKLSGTNF